MKYNAQPGNIVSSVGIIAQYAISYSRDSVVVLSFFFIHCYLETLQHLGHIASRIFGYILLLCVVNVSIVNFTELILWYMNLMNNGQMDRGNENPSQHLPWWLRKTTKKPQSGWSAPGFEPGTSRMRVSCVTTEPRHSFCRHSFFLIPLNMIFSLPRKC